MPKVKKEKNSPLDKKIDQANKKISALQKQIDDWKAKIEGYEKDNTLAADLERLKNAVVASDISIDEVIAFVEQKM